MIYMAQSICHAFVLFFSMHTPYTVFLNVICVASFLALKKCTHYVIFILIIFNTFTFLPYEYNCEENCH